jgi:L-lactate dehydrogenase complex protein LldG
LGIDVFFAHQFEDREAYKNCVFNEVNAGITTADFAVAESGTLVMVHDRLNSRLISLAPVLHIAVVPVDRVVPVYEHAVETLLGKVDIPAHITFVTGPSMTADIQGVMFKGMHGPRKIAVILVG